MRLTAAQACVRYLANQFIDERSARRCLISPASGRSSAMATSPASARRWPICATSCRLIGRITSRRWRTRRSLMPNRCGGAGAMVCTTSIGPGATNMVTAAALAHVNRLPVLFLPGDVYASRRPDPVLQQVEDFGDGTVSAQRLFPAGVALFRPDHPAGAAAGCAAARDGDDDRPGRPAAPRHWPFARTSRRKRSTIPSSFFERRVWRIPRQPADRQRASTTWPRRFGQASAPLIIAGGGVHYSGAGDALAEFAQAAGIPVAETQAGKGALPWDHPMPLGSIGVTGTSAANAAGRGSRSDHRHRHAVAGLHHRLLGVVRKSRTRALAQVNVAAHDAHKARRDCRASAMRG